MKRPLLCEEFASGRLAGGGTIAQIRWTNRNPLLSARLEGNRKTASLEPNRQVRGNFFFNVINFRKVKNGDSTAR